MLKKHKLVVALVLVGLFIFRQNSLAYANQGVDSLAPYQERLILLNNELGTNYILSPTGDNTYDEMVIFYTNMTLDEFEKYIRDAYAAVQAFDEVVEQKICMQKNTPLICYSTLEKQKYYYASNDNYLYIDAYIETANGHKVYTGEINSAGYAIASYPAYKVNSYTSSFSNDKRTVDICYSCIKYASQNLIYNTTYTINVIYGAGEGDIYPSA